MRRVGSDTTRQSMLQRHNLPHPTTAYTEGVAAAIDACRAAGSRGPLPTKPPTAALRPAESLLEAAAFTLQALHAMHTSANAMDAVLLLAEHVQTAREASGLLQCCVAVAGSQHAAVVLSPNCPLWRVLYVGG